MKIICLKQLQIVEETYVAIQSTHIYYPGKMGVVTFYC